LSELNKLWRVRVLPDPFAPEVIAAEHLSDQEAMVRIHLGAFANPLRGGVWRYPMTWPIVFFAFVCLVVLVFS